MVGVDGLGQIALEVAGEGRVEVLALMVLRIQLPDRLEREALHPEPVLQRLGDDISRGAVLLELDDEQIPLDIYGQQVDALAEVGDDLASNRKEISEAEDVDPLLNDLLQALLGADHTRQHLLHRLAVHPPKSELDWHRQLAYSAGRERSR